MTFSPSSIFFGVEIPEILIASEMQYHPADNLKKSRKMAGRALASKALLLAEAEKLDIQAEQEINDDGQQETVEEAQIRELLNTVVEPAEITPEAVVKLYKEWPDSFSTPPLLEASHILIAPKKDEKDSWKEAELKCAELITILQEKPKKFFTMAKTVSECPSAVDGGSLGQLGPGDVLNEIWTALLDLEPGVFAPHPVRTKYGWHVLRLDHRVDGELLPFDHVKGHIKTHLEMRAWTIAAGQYVDRLLRLNAAKLPGQALTPDGQLQRGAAGVESIHSVLGDLFSNPRQALTHLGGDSMAKIQTAAQLRGCKIEDVLTAEISSFMFAAQDEAWTQIISCLRESHQPVQDSLAIILQHQLPEMSKKSHVLDIGVNRKQQTAPENCHGSCS